MPDLHPEEMLLIGDSLTSDMTGGYQAGIDTRRFHSHNDDVITNIPVTCEITDLAQLADILT